MLSDRGGLDLCLFICGVKFGGIFLSLVGVWGNIFESGWSLGEYF